MSIKFKNWDCEILKLRYPNNRPALQLVDAESFEPIATATVNVPDYDFDNLDEKTHVLIKDYSENEGMLQALIEQKIVEDTGRRYLLSHFVFAPICKLLV